MDFCVHEAEIVARLKDQLDVSVKVEAYPNDPASYDFNAAGGCVLVRYQGSAFSTPEGNEKNTILQDRTAQWAVVMMHRSLRAKDAHAGAYTLIEAVRAALTGFTPAAATNPEASPLYPVQDGFLDRENGRWIYRILFAQAGPEAEA